MQGLRKAAPVNGGIVHDIKPLDASLRTNEGLTKLAIRIECSHVIHATGISECIASTAGPLHAVASERHPCEVTVFICLMTQGGKLAACTGHPDGFPAVAGIESFGVKPRKPQAHVVRFGTSGNGRRALSSG